MLTHENGFTNIVGNYISNYAKGLVQGTGSEVLSAINRYKLRLASTTDMIENLSVLLNSTEFIADELDATGDKIVNLSLDTSSELIAALEGLVDNDEYAASFSLCNGDGICIMYSPVNHNWVVNGDINTTDVDAMIFKDGNLQTLKTRWKTLSGRMITIYDFMQSLAINSTMNSVIAYACELISKGKFTIEAFHASVASFLTTAHGSVKQVYQSICDSYTVGGILGAAKHILNMAKGCTTVGVGSDGLLQFTDNATLAPKQYIAGMVLNVVGALVTFAGIIISIFSRIIGAAISMIGSALYSIGKVLNYDYNNETTAAIQDDDKVFMFQNYPHGFFCYDGQGLYPFYVLYALSMYGFFAIDVPGGTILVSKSAKGDDYYRAEFHPSVSKLIPSVGDFIGYDMITAAGAQDPNYFRIYLQIPNDGRTERDLSDEILNRWQNATQWNQIVGDDKQRLDASNDALMRNVCLANTAIFMLWSGLRQYGPHTTFVGKYIPGVWVQKNNLKMQLEFPSSGDTKLDAAYTCFAALAALLRYSQGFIDAYGYDAIQWYNTDPFTWTDIANIAAALNGNGQYNPTSYIFSFPLYDDKPATNTTPGSIRWASISSYPYAEPAHTYYVGWDIYQNKFIGDLLSVPSEYGYAILTPKYERSTFWFWVIFTSAVLAATIAVTVTLTIKGSKYIARSRATHAAKVEQAWNAFSADPSSENYKLYKSEVFKNNLLANIYGGTKYSKESYWVTSDNDGGGSGSGILTDALNNYYSNSNTDSDTVSLNLISKLITG